MTLAIPAIPLSLVLPALGLMGKGTSKSPRDAGVPSENK